MTTNCLKVPVPYTPDGSKWKPDFTEINPRLDGLTYARCLRCDDLIDFPACEVEPGDKPGNVKMEVFAVFIGPDREEPLCNSCTWEVFSGHPNTWTWSMVPEELLVKVFGEKEGKDAFKALQARNAPKSGPWRTGPGRAAGK